MPGEFHLSIKNTQRKIGDVRELFKDLTDAEREILQLAKQRAEAEKLLKTQLQAEKHMLERQLHHLQKQQHQQQQVYKTTGDLEQKSNPTTNLSRQTSMQLLHKNNSTMFGQPNLCKRIENKFNRCLSHTGINECPSKNKEFFKRQYNIIQKVSIKKPPKPVIVSNNQNSAKPMFKIRNHTKSTPSTPFKSSPKPTLPVFTSNEALSHNQRQQQQRSGFTSTSDTTSFNSFRNRIANFFNSEDGIDRLKSRLNMPKRFAYKTEDRNIYQNYYMNGVPHPARKYEQATVYFDYANPYQTQEYSRMQNYQSNVYNQTRCPMPQKKHRLKQQSPAGDKFFAIINKTKNFRF